MTYLEIKQALDGEVEAVGNLPTIYHENMMSKPVAGTPFVRTTILNSRPTQLTMGEFGADELAGLYQVDLYYPVGSGATTALDKANLIVEAFPRTFQTGIGLEMLRVPQCWVESGTIVQNWYVVRVMLRWTAVRYPA